MFQTQDGVTIVGDQYDGGSRFAILLHMMPETKESWRDFADALVKKGYTVLAIDERGHGESTMGGTLDYRKFSDEEQQAKRFDVEAAFMYVQTRGAKEETTVVIGASIGANLALRFLSEHSKSPVAIALSPGLDYHGVKTRDAVEHLALSQKAIVVASTDDPESYSDTQVLVSVCPSQVMGLFFQDLGHGTRMFEAQPALMDQLLFYLP